MKYKDLERALKVEEKTIREMVKYYLPDDYDAKEMELQKVQELLNIVRKKIRESLKQHQSDFFSLKDIKEIFLCSTQGGMLRSHKTNSLVLISKLESVYSDTGWKDNIFYYTGMGQEGDQRVDYAQNAILNNSNHNRIFIALFKEYLPKKYIYIGEVRLAGEVQEGVGKDKYGKDRKTVVFPLQVCRGAVYKSEEVIEYIINTAENAEKNEVKKVENDPSKLLALARKNGRKKPIKYKNNTRKSRDKKGTYKRSAAVRAAALYRANGVCECCDQIGPFEVNGRPYLVSHHIQWLEMGGEDTIENTCGICPNCHDRMHQLNEIERFEHICENVVRDHLKIYAEKISLSSKYHKL